MSPEQIRGDDVDRRVDVWSFGCVLFELLSRRRAFARDTTADTVAAVLERHDPRRRWGSTPFGTAIVKNAFVFNQVETTSSIWLLVPAASLR